MKEATYTISLSGGGATLPFKGKKRYSISNCISLMEVVVKDIIAWHKDIVITVQLPKGEKDDCISTGILFWNKIIDIASGIHNKEQGIDALNYILGRISIHVNNLIVIRNGKQIVYLNRDTLGTMME